MTKSAEIDAWLDIFEQAARFFRMPISARSARLAALWDNKTDAQARIRTLARAIGFDVRFASPDATQLTTWRLPVIIEAASGDLLLASAIDTDNNVAFTTVGDAGFASHADLDTLIASATQIVVPRPARSASDARVDTYVRPFEEHWLGRILLKDVRAYWYVAIASLVTNCLGLAGILFSMQVYDRVIPAQSMPTLVILFVGVLIAIGFDFLLRRLRVTITDVLGKRADLALSDDVFGHALHVRNVARPTSTGTFIAQLRDIDQVRDMLTSTTVAAIADLPFFLLFLIVLAFIGGWLALVPLAALVVLVAPSLAAQRRLRRYATESMRETSLRNALLVEAVQGIEDIKALQAEQRFQRQWNHCNAVAGDAQLRLRGLTSGLATWAQSIQSAVYAAVIFVGAPMVIAGDITTGTLIAASMLASRMMAPTAQISHLLGRYQHAKVAARSLDQIMALPVDTPEAGQRIPLAAVAGGYRLRDATFGYGDTTASPVLRVPHLQIAAGEKVALLGRNGAGKSTLLQGLSGLLQPQSGAVLLDDLALHQIDPADVRRDVSILSHASRLFHGTIRENLLMGAPNAAAEDIFAALAMTGATDFVQRLGDGLDHVVLEGGLGLSGGQVQSLLLARLILRRPVVALLDEPTAAMDEAAERHFIAHFAEWGRDRTIVVATHRMRMLDIVDRIIVLDNGAVILDQPRDAALGAMRAAQDKAA